MEFCQKCVLAGWEFGKKVLLMYATVIFTMTVVTAVIFMWMNKRYAEMLYQETTDSLFLISNEMKLYLDGIESRFLLHGSRCVIAVKFVCLSECSGWLAET